MHKTIYPIILTLILSTTISTALTEPNHTIETNKKSDFNTTTSLPPAFSWRNIEGIDYTTSIKNQAPILSCESFAFVAAVETMVQYQIGFPFECDLSEAHLFFYSGGNISWGSYPEDNADFLQHYGVPDEACWPYPTKKQQYPLNTTADNWMNRTVNITSWGHLPNNRASIKQALITHGPVIAIFQIYEDFMLYRHGIYQHRWGRSVGPHIVAIVGYNDNPGYWICKNSWGPEWGNQGWFNIKYGECLIDSYTIYITGVNGTFPIIYVDDDNTQGPWNGTQNHPYQTIQQGIDNAYPGYMVYVSNGTYQENLLINKSIKLVGENPHATIINGNATQDVIHITTKNIKIQGFTIQHSGSNLFDAGIEIRIGPIPGNMHIQNNIIQNNTFGIYCYGNSKNIITENNIINNNKGILLCYSTDNLIQQNQITHNKQHGIQSDWSQSTYNQNIITHNQECGLFLNAGSNHNIITNYNYITSNHIGISITDSHHTQISKNNLYNNTLSAQFTNSLLNTWRRNCWTTQFQLRPYLIFGKIVENRLPWVQIDFRPARQPYRIV